MQGDIRRSNKISWTFYEFIFADRTCPKGRKLHWRRAKATSPNNVTTTVQAHFNRDLRRANSRSLTNSRTRFPATATFYRCSHLDAREPGNVVNWPYKRPRRRIIRDVSPPDVSKTDREIPGEMVFKYIHLRSLSGCRSCFMNGYRNGAQLRLQIVDCEPRGVGYAISFSVPRVYRFGRRVALV